MRKTLVLELDNEYNMMRKTENCDYYNYFKYLNDNKLQKVLKKSCLIVAKNFFGEWSKKINEYELCVLFDRGFNKLITKYIKQNNPTCKIILWLWNPVGDRQKRFMNDKNIDEIWTYDKNDSKKYNIKFNTQFFNKNLVNNNKSDKEIYDIMFIGNNKGRAEIINKYVKKFKEKDLITYIDIIDNYNDNIKYEEYLNYLKNSRAVLEIVKDDVSGLTLRSLESIFFNKKLITNNKFIKEYDFYNPQNIFILGEDNLERIDDFIKEKYIINEEKIVNYYDFQEWINRFYKGE